MSEEEDPGAGQSGVVETLDDDGDAAGENDNDGKVDEVEAAMNAARSQAEARRKRILEKASKRMNYVNGEQIQDEEEKKTSISDKFNDPNLTPDDMAKYSKEIAEINDLIEEKELRWMELAEKA